MRPHSERLAPRGRDHQATPPQAPGSGARGPERDYGEPPPRPPPSPPPTRGQPEAGQWDGGPAPPPARPRGEPPPGRAATPREGRHRRGKRCCTPCTSSQLQTHSRSARGRPAALRRRARAPRGPQRDGGTRT